MGRCTSETRVWWQSHFLRLLLSYMVASHRCRPDSPRLKAMQRKRNAPQTKLWRQAVLLCPHHPSIPAEAFCAAKAFFVSNILLCQQHPSLPATSYSTSRILRCEQPSALLRCQ
ncbi:hypothetical protein BAUCODRAFT_284620 [Baudoinia panamericana UAMH 10762]|uniref:Secreted protein n=1 Tax=Baudoinia panamericana (strain UAMH 10762) TaxID=717646 RepID=M2LE89_BAUPA|nr:uncharacterized protein BAUCODRAFT_284620 [Baudoinia panamericana UAMH 10762]EMC92302.1 hypothetical protein BAUCODRAFT_284620 [Baudoinia panamericana UAMH 10762]